MKFLSKILVAFTFFKAEAKEVVIEQDFIDKVALIESNGNPKAVGDGGKAIGLFQIHKPAWQDAVNFLKDEKPLLYQLGVEVGHFKNYKKDCFDEKISATIATAYFIILQERFFKKNKKYPTELQLYMIYNMGYDGAESYRFDYNSPLLNTKQRLAIKRAKLFLK